MRERHFLWAPLGIHSSVWSVHSMSSIHDRAPVVFQSLFHGGDAGWGRLAACEPPVRLPEPHSSLAWKPRLVLEKVASLRVSPAPCLWKTAGYPLPVLHPFGALPGEQSSAPGPREREHCLAALHVDLTFQ